MNIQRNENEPHGRFTIHKDAYVGWFIRNLILTVTDLDDKRLEEYMFSWDFLGNEAGTTFELFTWWPMREVSVEEVREHFRELGAEGNVAAFLALITAHQSDGFFRDVPAKNMPLFRREGIFLTIPPDDKHLFQSARYGLEIPIFCQVDGIRAFRLIPHGDTWDDVHTFIAFREVTDDEAESEEA